MEFLLQRLGLVGRSAVYLFLERRYPARKVPFLRAGPGTDVLHLLFTEVFTNAVVPRGYLAQLTSPLPTSSRPSPTRSASPE
jgi:hypothetical protein